LVECIEKLTEDMAAVYVIDHYFVSICIYKSSRLYKKSL